MEFLWPLATYAFVSSITPGPNNIMLTSSGIRFGFMRSIPHMLGITCGFAVLLVICAAGIGSLVMAVPTAHVVLKLGGSGYLLYLAWQLRSMGVASAVPAETQPMRFMAAAVFQFANPKAWVMAITGAAAFLPLMQPAWLAIAIYCLVFCVVNLPCVSVWAGLGSVLRHFLRQTLWRKLFSAVMMLLTVYAALSIWL